MKKTIIAIVMLCVLTLTLPYFTTDNSNITLANIEALAQPEGPVMGVEVPCFNYISGDPSMGDGKLHEARYCGSCYPLFCYKADIKDFCRAI